jgi:hypothetical protein
MLKKTSQLKRFVLKSQDGEVGRIKDLYFDDVRWVVRYLVADTGKWLGLRQVLLSPHSVRQIRGEDKRVDIDLTYEQIEKSPPIDHDKPVSRQFEEEYHRYYNYPFYWQGAGMWGPLPRPGTSYGQVTMPPWGEPETTSDQRESGDPHLRSVSAVTGYRVQALDGEIGHIEDVVLNDADWTLEYLVVDTVNWWPGKKVLVPPGWATDISWHELRVSLNLDRATIKGAPEYDMSQPITREFETALFNYYCKKPYWEERKAA